MTFFVSPCSKNKIGHHRFTLLHLLSLAKWVSSNFQSSMTICHYKNVRMQTTPNFVMIIDIWMNLNINWDDNTCIPIHKKCR